jgi:hypothetical protein
MPGIAWNKSRRLLESECMPLLGNVYYFLLSLLQGVDFHSLAIFCAFAIDAGVIFCVSSDKAALALL